MSSIVFDGHDFSAFTTCSVEEGAHAVVPASQAVPGRAGALLLSARIPPRILKVRLFLDPQQRLPATRLSRFRHDMYGWLAATGGAVLRVPGDPALEWRDAVCTGASDWTSLLEDASCELEFTCFDPVAYGARRAEDGTAFDVGGTWQTWPTFELTAEAGEAVQVGHGGEFVRVERAFAGGESVRIDCETEAVTVDGRDARADVALESDFFALGPGECSIAYSGCGAHACAFHERWL